MLTVVIELFILKYGEEPVRLDTTMAGYIQYFIIYIAGVTMAGPLKTCLRWPT